MVTYYSMCKVVKLVYHNSRSFTVTSHNQCVNIFPYCYTFSYMNYKHTFLFTYMNHINVIQLTDVNFVCKLLFSHAYLLLCSVPLYVVTVICNYQQTLLALLCEIISRSMQITYYSIIVSMNHWISEYLTLMVINESKNTYFSACVL